MLPLGHALKPSKRKTSAPIPPKVTIKPIVVPVDNPFKYAFGLPQWVFDYKPKMPSRNMSIFLAVVIGTTSAYLYDRKECKRLQQEYIEKVKFMSLAPLESTELARRIKVYGARVPDDGELDRSSKWFKRYMRVSL
jgi:import inner membrane translocase subunit TIM54